MAANGLLLFLAARRAAQDVSFLALRNGDLLHFHFGPYLGPVFLVQQLRFKPLHLAARRATQYCPPRFRTAARFSSLTIPRSNTQMRRAFPYLRSTMRKIVSIVETSARLPSK